VRTSRWARTSSLSPRHHRAGPPLRAVISASNSSGTRRIDRGASFPAPLSFIVESQSPRVLISLTGQTSTRVRALSMRRGERFHPHRSPLHLCYRFDCLVSVRSILAITRIMNSCVRSLSKSKARGVPLSFPGFYHRS
jgi:hypothetical protein